MRAFGRFFFLTVLGVVAVRAQTTDRPIIASTRLQLKAAIRPADAKVGTPITVGLVLKNISSKVVRVADTSPEYDYELAVVDGSGKALPLTALGDRMYQGKFELLRSNAFDIKPGQEIQSEIEVTKIYQVTQPGTYYLRASHRHILPDPAEDARSTIEEAKRPIERAFSNPVQFTIVP